MPPPDETTPDFHAQCIGSVLEIYEGSIVMLHRALAAWAALLAVPTDDPAGPAVSYAFEYMADAHGPPPADPLTVTTLAAHAPPAAPRPRFQGKELAA